MSRGIVSRKGAKLAKDILISLRFLGFACGEFKPARNCERQILTSEQLWTTVLHSALRKKRTLQLNQKSNMSRKLRIKERAANRNRDSTLQNLRWFIEFNDLRLASLPNAVGPTSCTLTSHALLRKKEAGRLPRDPVPLCKISRRKRQGSTHDQSVCPQIVTNCEGVSTTPG